MIRILIDPQIFDEQKFGGISRYFTEIYTLLKNTENVEVTCPILYTDNIHFKQSPLYNDSYQKKYRFFIKNSRIFRQFLPRKLRKKNAANFIELLKKQDFDLFVPSYYNTNFLNYIGNKPFVITVHDMIHELYPQYFVNDNSTVPNKKLLAEKATKIIAVSENTKQDLVKIYPHVDTSKIEVIYLAPPGDVSLGESPSLPDNYILFVGNRTLYKNFAFFINSISPLLKQKQDLYLLCAGGSEFDTEELELLAKLGITTQVKQQKFEDDELYYYYSQAKCFVFPSRYEGFGIPVLEAMTYGCPVVLAKHSSFPEVAGNAAVYFEFDNPNDLLSKVKMLLDNEDIRKQYRIKGMDHVKQFTWQKTAQQCLKVYYDAVIASC